MSSVASPSAATGPSAVVRSLAAAAGRAGRAVWTGAFRDPARDNHLRLEGLGFVERHAARTGLVLLGTLLASTLLSRLWRTGDLYAIDTGSQVFIPAGLVAVTLVALLVAWTLVGWGALTASSWLRVVVAVVFALLNASLSLALPALDTPSAWTNRFIAIGYFGFPVLLLASIPLGLVPLIRRAMLPVLRVLLTACALGLFGSHLLARAEASGAAERSIVELVTSNVMDQIDGVLVPLVYVAGIVVIDFGLSVSEGLAEGARELTARLARWVLVAVLAVKLWVEVVQRRTDLYVYLRDRPDAVARTVLMLMLLVVVVRLVTRFPQTEAFENAKEGLLYGGGTALGFAILANATVFGAGMFVAVRHGSSDLPGLIRDYPALTVGRYANLVMAVAALVVGVLLVRGRRTHFRRELGSGLVVIGAWTLPTFVMQLGDYRIGFSPSLMDVVLTLGIAAYAAWRWRRLAADETVTLVALTVFAWLALSQGDWLAFLGGLLGLPGVFIVVVGIALTVLTDAGFTAGSSRRLPQGARVLLFVGYLLLSVTLLHWDEVAHTTAIASGQSTTGFLIVGIPWGGWLVGRRLVRMSDQPVYDERMSP
jgi:hypothetical protein